MTSFTCMLQFQVLATGLSGLYSDLPRKIEIPSEDWFRITDEEVAQIPEMSMFLNTLEFCNAVAQVGRSQHNENLPMQYTEIVFQLKKLKLSSEKC